MFFARYMHYVTVLLSYLLCLNLSFTADVQFSSEMPSDMKGNYLLIENIFGLSSRLRLLAGYMFEAEDFYKVPYIVMVWPLNKDCNAHFLDIFQPVKNVFFISREQQAFYSQHANVTFGNTWYSFERILFMHKITEYTIPHRRRMYKRFIAVPNIYRQVMQFVVEHDICNNVAIHVRRTDMELTHRRRSVTTDDEFHRFINSTSPNISVFFMGDNIETRKQYELKFPGKLIFYGDFIKDEASIKSGGRHTPITYAITEMLIAAHAYDFQGTVGSSFSELIAVYSDIFTSNRVCHKLQHFFGKETKMTPEGLYL